MKDYFINGRDRDKSELKLTRKAVGKASEVFPNAIENNRWPYDLQDGKKIDVSGNFSQSTNSMILFSLLFSSLSDSSQSCLVPKVRIIDPINADFDLYNSVWQELLNQSNERLDGVFIGSEGLKHATYSSTFGINDPLTLSWITEIISSGIFKDKSGNGIYEKILDIARDKLDNFFTIPIEPGRKSQTYWLVWKEDKRRFSIDHAFLALRYIQLAESLSCLDRYFFKSKWVNNYFETRIHEQLSKFEIRDGDFDAAELIFALEGLLRLEHESVSIAMLDRVFDVITESQLNNPYWRPVKPIVATPQGNVLYPLSVETAGSLLRCCDIIDKAFHDFNSFTKNIDLFRRFSEWLRARSVSGFAKKSNGEDFRFFGWHSEHVQLHPGIHIWETSNVLLFFQYYSAMLEKHIARCSLNSANLHEDYFNRTGGAANKEGTSPLNYWERPNGIVEPLHGIDNFALQPYSYAQHHILQPREKSCKFGIEVEKHFSFLLYGPPGTGKTTFAEEICKALEWPLITVTPSDFIHGGESEVESRAKRIFEVLEDQIDVVVLFDEIDRMILDRSSVGYAKQGDIFQFMTPSMLTKLRNLRKSKRVIFVIATNYKERIDSAAIRKGRIDEQLLMSPANVDGRKKLLKQIFTEKTRSKEYKDIIDSMDYSETAFKCSLLTYGEIDSLVNEVINKFENSSDRQHEKFKLIVDEKAKNISPSINLLSYKARFRGSSIPDDKPQYDGRPFVEFFTMLYIKIDGKTPFDEQENKVIKNVLRDLMDIESDKEWEDFEENDINVKNDLLKEQLLKRCPELGSTIIDLISLNLFK